MVLGLLTSAIAAAPGYYDGRLRAKERRELAAAADQQRLQRAAAELDIAQRVEQERVRSQGMLSAQNSRMRAEQAGIIWQDDPRFGMMTREVAGGPRSEGIDVPIAPDGIGVEPLAPYEERPSGFSPGETDGYDLFPAEPMRSNGGLSALPPRLQNQPAQGIAGMRELFGQIGGGGSGGVLGSPASADDNPVAAQVRNTATSFGIDPNLALAIVGKESSMGADAVTSVDGAVGVAQVLPGTAYQMYEEYASSPEPELQAAAHRIGDALADGVFETDTQAQIDAGLLYLRYGQDMGTTDPYVLAAGYHGGMEGAVRRGGPSEASDGLGTSNHDYAYDIVERLKRMGGAVSGAIGNAIASPAGAQEYSGEVLTSNSGNTTPAGASPGSLRFEGGARSQNGITAPAPRPARDFYTDAINRLMTMPRSPQTDYLIAQYAQARDAMRAEQAATQAEFQRELMLERAKQSGKYHNTPDGYVIGPGGVIGIGDPEDVKGKNPYRFVPILR